LSMSGLAPRADSAKITSLDAVPALGPAPVVYLVGNSGLAVYLFPDSLARARAAAALDHARFIPQSQPLGMTNETTAIQNDNLLALLFSRSEHQRERVSDALTAGAPQP
ncbi:MAG: hypothetical protein H0W68_13690, partial [Gemmatimonadaceae bacterium]|nr:hypothetical protein [Gemmatimonadaceae bacterium]